MHDAYEAEAILTKLPLQIESIAAYNESVLLGTRQGSLLVYGVKYLPGATEPKIDLERASRSFSKKPVTQLEVVEEYHIVISISDAVVSVHDLTVFAPITVINKTRGASLFAVDLQKQTSLGGDVQYTLRMCVANRRKLQLFYWKNREFHELQADVMVPDVPRAMSWCNDNICLGFKRDYHILQVHTGQLREVFTTGSALTPTITRLQGDRLALGRDEMTIIVDSSGTQTEKTALTWSDIPVISVHKPPYIVSVLPKYVEVRTVQPRLLIQSIDLGRPRFLAHCSNGVLYVASATAVWRLTPSSLNSQIKQLVLNKEYELALHLATLTDDSEAERRRAVLHIKNLYAFDLFKRHQFEESLKLFTELGTDPSHVVGLYPELLPQNYRNQLEYPDRLPVLEGVDLDYALNALIDYLTERRADLMHQQGDELKLTAIVDTNSTVTSRKMLSQIIDTTLLKCYLRTNDALVASLLRLPRNSCHVEECEKELRAMHKYSELIILYERKGYHKKALDLLMRESQKQSSPLKGIDQTVQYLQRRGPEQLQLILEYSEWVLQADPDEGLKIFTEDVAEVEALPRDQIIQFLTRVNSDLVIPYLSHIIHVWSDDTQEFHNQLALRYCDVIKQLLSTRRTGALSLAQQEELARWRRKLMEFLDFSRRYLPERLLAHIPFEDFFEERAVLLGRLGRHEQALAIYVHILGDVERAEQYCERNWSAVEAPQRDVFVLLLRLLLARPEPAVLGVMAQFAKVMSHDPHIALNVLRRHANQIDTSKALELLPHTTPVSAVEEFLCDVLEERGRRRKKSQVLKGLLSAERLQVQEQRISLERVHCCVTDDTVCGVCKKRIGSSAFARQPAGDLVHFCCRDPKSPQD